MRERNVGKAIRGEEERGEKDLCLLRRFESDYKFDAKIDYFVASIRHMLSSRLLEFQKRSFISLDVYVLVPLQSI